MRSGIVSGINPGIKIGVPAGFKEMKVGVRSGLTDNYVINDSYQDPITMSEGPKVFFLPEEITKDESNVVTGITNMMGPSQPNLAVADSPTFVANSLNSLGSISLSSNSQRVYFDPGLVNFMTAIFVANIDENCTKEIMSITGLEALTPPSAFDSASRQGNYYLRSDNGESGYFEGRLLGKEDSGVYEVYKTYNSKSNRHVLRRKWNLFTVKVRFEEERHEHELFINGERVKNVESDITLLDLDSPLDLSDKNLSIGAPYLLPNYGSSYDGVAYNGEMKIAGFMAFDRWVDNAEQVRLENYFRRYYNENFR